MFVTRSSTTRGKPAGSRVPAATLYAVAVSVTAMQGLVGCGDAMLPSDYVGPPAANVSGIVFSQSAGITPDALRPRMTLEWLTEVSAAGDQSGLVGQPLRLKRSERIQSDWDIGLETPVDGAKMTAPVASTTSARGVGVGVGKMIYFDDRDGDGRLNWNCSRSSGTCDQIKAVSRELVAFVDAPVFCSAGLRGETGQRFSAGYHYFRMDGMLLHELGPGESMSFVLGDRTLAESDPREELRRFAAMLIRLVSSGPLAPC